MHGHPKGYVTFHLIMQGRKEGGEERVLDWKKAGGKPYEEQQQTNIETWT
jgi:hypothetical protein